MAVERPGLVSFRAKDHGDRRGGDLEEWIRASLKETGLEGEVERVTLVCMPRILGYVFNPVSFWLCEDADGGLRAVLAEVNNTFGETHSYVCAHRDGRPIGREDRFEAKKLFHVSPFLERNGDYQFRFVVEEGRLAIRIDYLDEQGEPTLQTSVAGRLEPLSKGMLRLAIVRHPLLTMRVSWLIHWQALRLLIKGVKIVPKPRQMLETFSKARQQRDSSNRFDF